jgi:flagellar basal-body rod protein FlgC
MLKALDVSASGLLAQRQRLDVIAQNLANVNTTRDAQGRPAPYRRQVALVKAQPLPNAPEAVGVTLAGLAADPTPFRRAYEPTHPDADGEGYVNFPNVDVLTETVDALAATRAYEANITAIEATKGMVTAALRILA